MLYVIYHCALFIRYLSFLGYCISYNNFVLQVFILHLQLKAVIFKGSLLEKPVLNMPNGPTADSGRGHASDTPSASFGSDVSLGGASFQKKFSQLSNYSLTPYNFFRLWNPLQNSIFQCRNQGYLPDSSGKGNNWKIASHRETSLPQSTRSCYCYCSIGWLECKSQY